jgi:hypothetical protein
MHHGKNQRKTSPTVQLKTRGAAPPVYRPNPVPRVCQLKSALPPPKVVAGNRVVQAPPVYRPQPVAKVLQRKVVNHSPANLGKSVQAANPPRSKVIQRNINSTHFEKSAAVDPLYMVDRQKRDTLYSRTTAPAPRPRGLYSKKAETDDATGAQVYAWKPNVRFLSRAEMRFDRETRRYPVEGGHRVLDVPELFREVEEAHVPGALEQPTFGILGKNDCTSFAQALHYSIARENYQAGEDEEFYQEREADYPDITVGDMMVHKLNGGAAGWHGVTVVAEHGNRQVFLEADVRRDSTVPQFHIQQGVAGFVAFNVGDSAETSTKVAVTRYIRGKPSDSDLRRYQTAMTADPLTLVGGTVTTRRINPDVYLPLGHLIHNAKWNTQGSGWFGSKKTPDGVVKMRAAYGRRHYLEVFRIAEAKNKTEDSDRTPLVRDLYEYLSEVWDDLKHAAARSLEAFPLALRQHMADIARWNREISMR